MHLFTLDCISAFSLRSPTSTFRVFFIPSLKKKRWGINRELFFRVFLVGLFRRRVDLNLARERHKIRTTASKVAREYMTGPKRRRNKSSFLVAGENARGVKEVVTTIWLCFVAVRTCVACSYIILYGWQRRYPSFIQRRLRPARNIWRGLIYTGIKMSPSRMLISPIARTPSLRRSRKPYPLTNWKRYTDQFLFGNIWDYYPTGVLIKRNMKVYKKKVIANAIERHMKT